jgi:glutamate-1-semialdehyde 2,1-aminomutase
MNLIADGPLFHGGVFSGNAVVMSASEAVLDTVLADKENIYDRLNAVGGRLASGMRDILTRLGVPHQVYHVGSLLAVMLTKEDVDEIANYRDVRRHCDFDRYIQFQHHMQRTGVYFHPNQFETMFLSTAHAPEDIDLVLERMEEGARKCLAR